MGNTKMRFATTTLGCKVNQCDTRALDKALVRRGHEHVTLGDGCDLCVVNTCSVTAESVRKSRQTIRRIKKLEPTAFIAVCGCYSQLQPDEVKALGVDFVSGTGDKEKLALEIEQVVADRGTVPLSAVKQGDVGTASDKGTVPLSAATRTRAFLKIQDGCDNYCAYCIIPYARGASRSEPIERIVAEAKEYMEQGYNEIVITGIEISSYGKDLVKQGDGGAADRGTVLLSCEPHLQVRTSLKDKGTVPLSAAPPSPCFLDVVEAISLAAPKIRLRIGSLDPSTLSPDFVKKLAEIPQLCNHFHISLQSGCDETLLRMGRGYKTAQVESAMASLRENFKDCAITADLITGFPGETDKEFQETLDFIKNAKFSNMHIFPFSPRPGTKAADMPCQVEKTVSKERAHLAAEIAEQNSNDFKAAQIGKVAEVLFEQQKNGYSIGHTTNYIEVAVKGDIERNTIHGIQLTGVENGGMTGEITVPIISN